MNNKNIVWREYHGRRDDWNSMVIANLGSPYQLYEWGQYKRTSSWESLKVIAENDCGFVYAANILVKRYLFFAVCYIPSGGIGSIDILDDTFYQFVRKSIGVLFVYFRISFQKKYSKEESKLLSENNWRKAKYVLGSSHTMIFDLLHDEDIRLSKASKNWRHNYKRSQKKDIIIRQVKDSDIAIRILRDMESFKSLDTIFSDIEIRNILEKLKNILLLYYATNTSGVLLGMRGALISGNTAVDFIAATTKRGRKEYSSYALFWKLTSECSNRGVISYDMGGFDKEENIGVYNFKKGTGSELMRFLGGYEWSGSNMSNITINTVVFLRNGKKLLENLKYFPRYLISLLTR